MVAALAPPGLAVRSTRSFTVWEAWEMLEPGSTTRSVMAMLLAFRPSVLLMKPSIVVAKAYVPSDRYEDAWEPCHHA